MYATRETAVQNHAHRQLTALTAVMAMLFALALPAGPAEAAVDDALAKRAEDASYKAIEFLRKTQNKDGSWSPRVGPAVTALVMHAMVDHPKVSADDPAVRKALKYVLSRQQKDGGIYEMVDGVGIILNYNTAICLSALSRFNDEPEVAAAIKKGLKFMRGIQYAGGKDEQGHDVVENHPFYGGFGYGKHGRPDGSNTQIAIQAFFDNNIECDKDPAMKRALLFTQRLQGIKSNDMHGKAIKPDGGAIYATSVNKDKVGVPQSQAGTDEDGKLRTYGSMTYAMFKTYVYARLDRDDPRVKAALGWIGENYRFDVNPGFPDNKETEKREDLQGYYYYLLTAARALDAFGEPTVKTADGKKRDWRTDITKQLLAGQREDGSWLNDADRWMEGDPNLVTAYVIHALHHAAK